jgi:hypothetical protein
MYVGPSGGCASSNTPTTLAAEVYWHKVRVTAPGRASGSLARVCAPRGTDNGLGVGH